MKTLTPVPFPPFLENSLTMLPLAEVDDETDGDLLDSDLMDSDLFASLETGPTGGTDSTGGTHSTREPVAGEIQDAIEAGNWEAVGQTAAMLSGEDMDNATRESGSSRSWQSSNYSSSTARTGVHSSAGSDGSTYEDAAKAAEIDGLVETGDWDGVVAVAARYAEEASEAESDLMSRHSRGYRTSSSGYPTSSSGYPTSSSGYPTSSSGGATGSSGTVSGITNPDTRTDSAHSSLLSKASSAEEDSRPGSVGSVSVETADETNSAYSNSTRGGQSYVTGTSMDTSRDLSPETASRGTDASSIADSRSGSSTVSGSTSGYGGAPGIGASTAGSSITNDDLTSTGSTFTGTIGGPDPEARQQKAYRAEVEALVRRVVPDEIDNVDDIMVQFSGREEELIETLRAMQEKSIAQRARAAVQRSAKMEGRAAGRTPERRRGFDDSSSAASDTMTMDGQDSTVISETSAGTGFDNRTATTASGMSSVAGTSITEEFTEGGDGDSQRSDYSSGSSGYSSRGSYYSSDEDGGDGYSRGSSARKSSSGPDRKRSEGSSTNIDDLIDGGDWGGIISAANSMSGGHLSGEDSDLD